MCIQPTVHEIRQLERLKVDVEPKHLLVLSEPYVILTHYGYAAAIEVYERKRRRHYEMLIGAKSLSESLASLVEDNGAKFSGIDFWVWKENTGRMAKYIVKE